MNRLQQKCLIASAGLHFFLLLILVIGAAFFMPEPTPVKQFHRLKVVPTKLIDEALSGGGGNPKIAPTEEVQKGTTLTPLPAPPAEKPAPTPPKQPDPAPPIRQDPPPEKEAPKEETKPTPEPRPKDPPAATRPKTSKPTRPVVKERPRPVKPDAKSSRPTPEPSAPLELKPVVRNEVDSQKMEAESRARAEKLRRAQEAERAYAETKHKHTSNQLPLWDGRDYIPPDCKARIIHTE